MANGIQGVLLTVIPLDLYAVRGMSSLVAASSGPATTKPNLCVHSHCSASKVRGKLRALRWSVVEVKPHPVVGVDIGKPSAAQRLRCEQIVLFFSVSVYLVLCFIDAITASPQSPGMSRSVSACFEK